jgi:uncharacterized protein YciW
MIFSIVALSMLVGFAGFLVCLVAAGIKVLYESWKNKDEVH